MYIIEKVCLEKYKPCYNGQITHFTNFNLKTYSEYNFKKVIHAIKFHTTA